MNLELSKYEYTVHNESEKFEKQYLTCKKDNLIYKVNFNRYERYTPYMSVMITIIYPSGYHKAFHLSQYKICNIPEKRKLDINEVLYLYEILILYPQLLINPPPKKKLFYPTYFEYTNFEIV